MTDAPTTRADHAELARLRQHIVNLKLRPGHHVQFGTPSVSQISNYWNRDLAADLENLLSEIAALRGERDAEIERHGETFEKFRQAERQRDELRKALGRIKSGRATVTECSLIARQALTNQGADQ